MTSYSPEVGLAGAQMAHGRAWSKRALGHRGGGFQLASAGSFLSPTPGPLGPSWGFVRGANASGPDRLREINGQKVTLDSAESAGLGLRLGWVEREVKMSHGSDGNPVASEEASTQGVLALCRQLLRWGSPHRGR